MPVARHASPAMSPSLGARRPSSTASTSPSRPATASASSARTGSARRRCCWCWPASSSPIGARSSWRRRAPPSATCPRSPIAGRGDGLRASWPAAPAWPRRSAELDDATQALSSPAPGADDRYALALDRWLPSAAPTSTPAPARCGRPRPAPALLDQPTTTLSGGQAARVELAAILLSRFDVLLLDEPTNDLDLDGLDRLERFVDASRPAGAGQPRPRLPRAHRHERPRAGRAHPPRPAFEGGWLAYLEEQGRPGATPRRPTAVRRPSRRPPRAGAPAAGVGPGGRQPGRQAAGTTTRLKRHVHRQRRGACRATPSGPTALERLEAVDKPWEGWELRLEVAAAPRSGDVVARLDGAVVERGAFRLGPVDLEIGWADRVAIVGPNGGGKTTLLGALLGAPPRRRGAPARSVGGGRRAGPGPAAARPERRCSTASWPRPA